MPCRVLPDTQVTVEFHTRHAFQIGNVQVDRPYPITIADLRTLHNRPDLDGEVFPAVRAPIGHRLFVRDFAGAGAFATRAMPAIGPEPGFKPQAGRPFIGEHIAQFLDCNTTPFGFSGRLVHGESRFVLNH